MILDNYLTQHYKGKYRIKAHYDLSTNDFVRDANGELDDSFGDFYLSGRSGIEIHHGVGSELACYIPKLQLGINILKSYYKVWGYVRVILYCIANSYFIYSIKNAPDTDDYNIQFSEYLK